MTHTTCDRCGEETDTAYRVGFSGGAFLPVTYDLCGKCRSVLLAAVLAYARVE